MYKSSDYQTLEMFVMNEKWIEELEGDANHGLNTLFYFFHIDIKVASPDVIDVLRKIGKTPRRSESDEFADVLVKANGRKALLTERIMVNAKYLEEVGAERLFRIPMDSYQILDWLVKEGDMWSPHFHWGKFALCAVCEEEGISAPAPYLSARHSIPLCPQHRRYHSVIQSVLFEHGWVKVPNEQGVIK